VTSGDDAAVLRRALDQPAGLLDDVPAGAQGNPTPCARWTVQDLVDHLVAAPANFALMLRGQPVDWSAPAPAAGEDPAAAFRANADDLRRAWREREPGSAGISVDWLCAEFAVHTWDLASAMGRSTADLDAEVAERGLAFMRANLTEHNRSPAFGPERPAPEGADAYRRAAAFAGRSV
jgi:uncharacterized protein (TIGR03086 family)